MKGSLPLSIALRALARHKARSALSVLGIVVGVAAIIVMVSVGQGATASVQAQITSLGNNLIMIEPVSLPSGGARGRSGSAVTLTGHDADAIARECPAIRSAAPIAVAEAQAVYGGANWASPVWGTNPDFPDVRNWRLDRGGFFTESDVRNANKVCVLGYTVVDELFGAEDPVGKALRVNNVPFRVIGVLARKGRASAGLDWDNDIVVPWTTCKQKLAGSPYDNVNMIFASVRSGDQIEPAYRQVRALLRQRHRLGPDRPDDFRVNDMREIAATYTQISRILTLLLTVTASISMLVGGIGIMNILLAAVKERTREIGIRMAVGASRSDVRRQFLAEAIALTCLGGCAGVALGALVSKGVAAFAGWPVLITPAAVAAALASSASVGIFFGLYPAWKACRLDPVGALRYE